MADDTMNSYTDMIDSQSRMHDLPLELLIHIIDFLDWPSITSLRLTSPKFRILLPSNELEKRYTKCRRALHEEELSCLRRVEKEYWEQAEQSFLGYHSSSYTSSSLDPDIRAYNERCSTNSSRLPCYRCLRWLPSITDLPDFATSSLFSRGMCTGTRNLGAKDALSRICIPCGIRTRLYNKGTCVKRSVVCLSCGVLSSQRTTTNPVKSRQGQQWKHGWWCEACLILPEVENLTHQQLWHEFRWKKYEESMIRGKQYRLEKGKRLRQEQCGTESNADESKPIKIQSQKFRWCPIMKEMRLCGCQTLEKQAFSNAWQNKPYVGIGRTWSVR